MLNHTSARVEGGSQPDLTVDGANSPYLVDGTAAHPGGSYGAYDPADGDNLFNDISLTFVTPVPEPSTWGAAALALGAIIAEATRARRRGRRAEEQKR